jgi:hypothetical protein
MGTPINFMGTPIIISCDINQWRSHLGLLVGKADAFDLPSTQSSPTITSI